MIRKSNSKNKGFFYYGTKLGNMVKLSQEMRHYKCREGGEIFIESQTGTGKTTFVLDVLVPYAMEKGREVLFLSNRFLLKEQIKAKVAKK